MTGTENGTAVITGSRSGSLTSLPSFSRADSRRAPRGALLARKPEGEMVSRDTNLECEEMATFGERVADRIVSFGGSWTFIILFTAVFTMWVGLNSFVLMMRGVAFDPYPYILLNLMLSTIAAFQAPIIMMSQNRQATKDRIAAGHAYEVNLNMETEIRQLHKKLDAMGVVLGDGRHAANANAVSE